MSEVDSRRQNLFRTAGEAAFLTARATYSFGTIDGLSGNVQGAIHLIGLATVLELMSPVLKKWADDPPRDDYESATRVARSSLREEGLARSDDPVAQTALTATLSIDYSTRQLAAGLRAFERMQGALERGSPDASRRAEEASAYTHEAAYALISSGNSLSALAEVIEQHATRWSGDVEAAGQPDSITFRAVVPAEPAAALPSEVLAGLYLLGIRIEDLERTTKQRGARYWRGADAHREAEQLVALGDSLRNWEPKSATE